MCVCSEEERTTQKGSESDRKWAGPDKDVEEEDCAADDAGSAGLLVLRAGQCQPVIHVALMMHDGLNESHNRGKLQMSEKAYHSIRIQDVPFGSFCAVGNWCEDSPTYGVHLWGNTSKHTFNNWLLMGNVIQLSTSPFSVFHPFVHIWHLLTDRSATDMCPHAECSTQSRHIWFQLLPCHQPLSWSPSPVFPMTIGKGKGKVWQLEERKHAQFVNIQQTLGPVDIAVQYLGGAETKGCGLDVSLLLVHEDQALVLHQTKVLPSRDVPETKGLAPTSVTATPSAFKKIILFPLA